MLTAYETRQLASIHAWRAEPPPIPTRLFAKASAPAVKLVQRAIPVRLLRAALNAVQTGAIRTQDVDSILTKAGAADLDALQLLPLPYCDALAASVRRRGTVLAGSSGAVFGIAGAFGLAADIPTLLLQAFRVIHRIGLCYGEDCAAPALRRLPIAIFALASANSVEEKQAALDAIDHAEDVRTGAWRDGVERTAERQFAKEAAVYSLNNLGKTLTERFGVRKAAGSLPVLGALVGGTVNAMYLHDVAATAQRVFQQRRLDAKTRSAEPVTHHRPARKAVPKRRKPAPE